MQQWVSGQRGNAVKSQVTNSQECKEEEGSAKGTDWRKFDENSSTSLQSWKNKKIQVKYDTI